MQNVNAWLWPRRYYVYSKKMPRIQPGPFVVAVMGGVIILSLGMLVRARVMPQALSPAQAKLVALPTIPETEKTSAQTPPTIEPVSSYIGLQQPVNNWINAHKSVQWGVDLQDVANPINQLSINAGESFEGASIYKLFLTIPLAARLPFSSWRSQYVWSEQGRRTYADCVQAMLSVSDNPCGVAVGSYLGWARVSQSLHSQGFGNTSLLNSPITTTAADTASYLVGLQQGKWFDAQTRTFILASLAQQRFRSGIPQGCSGCTVLNKTGQLDGYTHDAAIIQKGTHVYVLAIFSKGGSYEQIAQLSQLINSQIH